MWHCQFVDDNSWNSECGECSLSGECGRWMLGEEVSTHQLALIRAGRGRGEWFLSRVGLGWDDLTFLSIGGVLNHLEYFQCNNLTCHWYWWSVESSWLFSVLRVPPWWGQHQLGALVKTLTSSISFNVFQAHVINIKHLKFDRSRIQHWWRTASCFLGKGTWGSLETNQSTRDKPIHQRLTDPLEANQSSRS